MGWPKIILFANPLKFQKKKKHPLPSSERDDGSQTIDIQLLLAQPSLL